MYTSKMKFQVTSLILLSSIPAIVQAGCLSEDPTFTGVSGIPNCSFGRFKRRVNAARAARVAAGDTCKKLKHEISDLFGGADPNASLREACGEAIEASRNNVLGSFEDIFDERLTKEFYDGNTDINQQVQQRRPNAYNLNNDIGNEIIKFHKNVAKKGIVEWPNEYVENFNSCEMNTVMCCWVTDRKVDNNGNGDCAGPYPKGSGPEGSNCVDADPADNTDVCYADHERSPQANHVEGGFTIFDGEAEGPSHCHGFAWSDDPLSDSNRFMGNALFYVSLKDHLRDRGYVRNVPGAPMCGCLEQMPTVSRSDCTETTAKDTFDFSYDHYQDVFTAEVVKTNVNFNDCGSLREHYEELVNEGEVEENDEFSTLIVGDDQCTDSIDTFLADQGIERI